MAGSGHVLIGLTMLKHNTYFDGKVQSVGFERNGRETDQRGTEVFVVPAMARRGLQNPD